MTAIGFVGLGAMGSMVADDDALEAITSGPDGTLTGQAWFDVRRDIAALYQVLERAAGAPAGVAGPVKTGMPAAGSGGNIA